ncbi:creatininase family protein [Consotaella salsifontis]|uniref:Creatinine amidohydrolase n=1 Tax=Consotaella salsifontis TaxID=1365950 RepID=A0A1T4S2T3_9HYPH|nr:creatininase family protein [Consotaella salsifontis]SKA22534.1 creatinine amidohydrolase [Consotaella salsifontis]
MSDILYSVRGPKSWTTMTSQELAERLAETDVTLVPVGAIEQHAGHLPLGQDNFQIEEIVRRAVLKLEEAGRKAIFGPTIPYGPIANLRFPGSIDLKPSTLILLVKEVCLNLYRDGVRNIALVMGHDMSLGALMVAARELAHETDDDLKVIVLNWLPLVVQILPTILASLPPELTRNIPKNARDGHGGMGETARQLWQNPELVVTERMKDYVLEMAPPAAPFVSPVVSGGGVYAPRKTTNEHPDYQGILGFPTVASAEMGDKLYEALSDWVATVVGEFCYGSLPQSYSY